MDYLRKFKSQIFIRVLLSTLAPLVLTMLSWFISQEFLSSTTAESYIISGTTAIFTIILSTYYIFHISVSPVLTLESVISYAAHNDRASLPPNLDKIRLGRELIAAQSLLIYDLASVGHQSAKDSKSVALPHENAFNNLPVPIIGTGSDLVISSANTSAIKYLGLKDHQDALGKPLYDILQLSFQGEDGFEQWLKKVKETEVTATQSWQRVRHGSSEDAKQFDLVASYSKDNSSGIDIVLALFDRTNKYHNDDLEVSFVAMAVHELRTPLTLMRGYIEVFEDELGPTLPPELADFMHKMHASSQQLNAFVSNILNVARIEENQLSLKLTSENWAKTLKAIISDLELRSQVYGKHIELQIADDLPLVAADRISIHEVINNIVDNAIKYGGKSDKIIVSSKLNADGLIETSVQDFGIGIPEAVMGQLFKKFHRSHRTSSQIGGTGLGLYLSKALVAAHGGNIWVRSKEGEGSTFTFTLIPYEQLSEEETANQDGIIRGAHGWIKNHSLYRN